MFGNRKGPIEALKDLLGVRGYARRTNGTPARSEALVLCYAYAKDFDDNEYIELAKELADAWAGEGGWDTQQAISAIRAAAPIRTDPMEGGNDDEPAGEE